MGERVTLKNIESLINATGASIKADLATKLDGVGATIASLATKAEMEESIDALARITAKGFEDVRRDLGADISSLDAKLTFRIDSLDTKLDYHFNSLSSRIDDLALNKISRDEHRVLAARVSDIEERLI